MYRRLRFGQAQDLDELISGMQTMGIGVRKVEEIPFDMYDKVKSQIVTVSDFLAKKGVLEESHFSTDDGSVGPLKIRKQKTGAEVVLVEAPSGMTGRKSASVSDEPLHYDPQGGYYLAIISMRGGERRLFRVLEPSRRVWFLLSNPLSVE